MTNGLTRNTARLFNNEGKIFVLAMDRGQAGAVPGLEDVVGKMNATTKSELDGYLVNLGPARRMAEGELVNKKLLLRTSFGGSAFCGEYLPGHYNFISPENALALGADAVVMMMSSTPLPLSTTTIASAFPLSLRSFPWILTIPQLTMCSSTAPVSPPSLAQMW